MLFMSYFYGGAGEAGEDAELAELVHDSLDCGFGVVLQVDR